MIKQDNGTFLKWDTVVFAQAKQIEERERQLEQEKQRLKELESTSTLIRVKNKQKAVGTAQLQWPMSAFII